MRNMLFMLLCSVAAVPLALAIAAMVMLLDERPRPSRRAVVRGFLVIAAYALPVEIATLVATLVEHNTALAVVAAATAILGCGALVLLVRAKRRGEFDTNTYKMAAVPWRG